MMGEQVAPTPEQMAQLAHIAQLPALLDPKFAFGHVEMDGVKHVLFTLFHPTAGPINMLLSRVGVENVTSSLAMLIAPARGEMS